MWRKSFQKSRSPGGTFSNLESQRLSCSVLECTDPQGFVIDCNCDLILYSFLCPHCLNSLPSKGGVYFLSLEAVPVTCLGLLVVEVMLCWFCLKPETPCVFPLVQLMLLCHSHANIHWMACWRLRYEEQGHVIPVALAEATLNQLTDLQNCEWAYLSPASKNLIILRLTLEVFCYAAWL